MTKVEWGKKVVCQNCETKFYDLNRKPAICPNCGTEYTDPASETVSIKTKQENMGNLRWHKRNGR